MSNHLLPDEVDGRLLKDSAVEKVRQDKSYADRLKARINYANKTKAVPPTDAEMQSVRVFVDDGVVLPREWLATLVKYDGIRRNEPYEATMFVADLPSSPRNSTISLAAVMMGAWVVTPAVFVGQQGASIKYDSIAQKRLVWVSESFKQTFAREFIVLLEVLKRKPELNWKFLASPEQWAINKAEMERRKTPAFVLALVGRAEVPDHAKHVFALESLVSFLARTHPVKGSIGILNM